MAKAVEPQISESTVKRDIVWIKTENEKWWIANSTIKARMLRYMKERFDCLQEITREGWQVVQHSNDDLKMKVSGLNVILGAERTLSEMLGFARISMFDLEVQERLEQTDVELTRLRRLANITEKNVISP